jgi:hypothetical protein
MNPDDMTNDAEFFLAPRGLIPRIRLLKSSSVACLLYLWSRPADKKGWIAAGASEIGRACKIKSRTAFSALARLEELRLIQKRRKAGQANAYRLLWGRRPRRPAPAKSDPSQGPGAAAADPTDPHAQTVWPPLSQPERVVSLPESPDCASSAAESETGGPHKAETAPPPRPEKRNPTTVEQIMGLLQKCYRPCDMKELKELKSRCGIDEDQEMLEKLIRFHQLDPYGVDKEKSIGFLASTIMSPRYK